MADQYDKIHIHITLNHKKITKKSTSAMYTNHVHKFGYCDMKIKKPYSWGVLHSFSIKNIFYDKIDFFIFM